MAYELKQAKIGILVDRKNQDGTTTYEWREVDGHVIDLGGVTLRNGENLTIDHHLPVSEPGNATGEQSK